MFRTRCSAPSSPCGEIPVGLAALWLVLLSGTLPAAPPRLVVETDPLPPDQQRGMFHLPPGFEIQLIASEPDIGQPMNLNFDAAGRLWITSSHEYPYPADGPGVEPRDERFGEKSNPPPRDWLTVVEGIGPDGKPSKIHRFAEQLNIPIGILPVPRGAILFSIPDIKRLTDSNGDGVADESAPLYGPFGNVDTHGMVNSFTRWVDGWVYACHGFRNTSNVQGSDGEELSLNSGNSIRFREDGSRIERLTWGQVNPFGLTFDPWGNLYSADCHSKPLTCLLRGGYYQSFGKPHDGLGFAPDMIDHNHGSTGICGAAWYQAKQFPAEYQDHIFLCNPVTGQVHRDRIDWRGSSPWVVSQPDFITCDDGWFRPVDVKLGPDGALYVADFYNCIIGHYEVPLDHPRRDRTHGRVWRVVYRGTEEQPAETPSPPDLTSFSREELLAAMGDPNFTLRTLATNQLIDATPPAGLRSEIKSLLTRHDGNAEQRANAIWVAMRTGALDDSLARSLLYDASPLVRTHAARALAELPAWSDAIHREVAIATGDAEPQVQRAAADALGRHPAWANFESSPLLRDYPQSLDVMGEDTHLRHVTRMALRNHLERPEIATALRERAEKEPQAWADIALGSTTPAACSLLLTALNAGVPDEQRTLVVQHLARYGSTDQLRGLLDKLASGSNTDLRQQVHDLRSVQAGLQQRGEPEPDTMRTWGERLATSLLDSRPPARIEWTAVPYGKNARAESAFTIRARRSSDKDTESLFFDSLPRGETVTGILRSDPFPLPAKLTFYMAGHNGYPDMKERSGNLIRLVDVETRQTLRETPPPRNDTARPVEWDLAGFEGRRGRIEIQDGDSRQAFAWLAVGRFSLDELNPLPFSPWQDACELVGSLQLASLEPRMAGLAQSDKLPLSMRRRAAEALLALHPGAPRAALVAATAGEQLPPDLRNTCLAIVSTRQDGQLPETLQRLFQSVPAAEAQRLALLLAQDRVGAAQLLDLLERGRASTSLLLDPTLTEKLQAVSDDPLRERLARITSELPDRNEQLDQRIAEARERYHESRQPLDAERARKLFQQHCAACHLLDGVGEKIGPQLDGIGVRGADRLLEDLLDPNRNVDVAFRTTILVLKSGEAVSGLLRREEGATLVLADQKGKEQVVSTEEVELRKQSNLSLMPANVGDAIPAEDLQQIVRALVSSLPSGK